MLCLFSVHWCVVYLFTFHFSPKGMIVYIHVQYVLPWENVGN